jgi:6-phosphogluconolactonase
MQQLGPVQFVTFPEARALEVSAAELVRREAESALSDRGRFRILLAGGTTPLMVYRRIARDELGWDGWEVYFGDERCLPTGDPQRNSQAAREVLLGAVPIPDEQIFPIPAELGAETAAASYADMVAGALPFDLVLLGMGEDGHTASLFPGNPVDDEKLVIPVHGAPKPPSDRVSLTFSALADCRRMLILVTGEGKRPALAAWRSGADLPVARAARLGGATVLVDAAAAG